MNGNTGSPLLATAFPNLKASNHNRSISPPKKTPAKTHQEFARGSYKEEPLNEFIDHHKTFYTSLLKKIKTDSVSKKTSSIFKDNTLHASRRAISMNTGIADQSDVNIIKRNINKVVEKPPVKQFKYLEEDERIRRAIEPKRLIRGLDELYDRIDRIFVKQSDDEDYSPRHQIREYQSQRAAAQNIDRSPSKTPEQRFFVKKRDVKILVKKKSHSNLTKDDKPEAVVNGIEKSRGIDIL